MLHGQAYTCLDHAIYFDSSKQGINKHCMSICDTIKRHKPHVKDIMFNGGGVQGSALDLPPPPKKKANLAKIKKKEGKKSQNQENLRKLPQCHLRMGQK